MCEVESSCEPEVDVTSMLSDDTKPEIADDDDIEVSSLQENANNVSAAMDLSLQSSSGTQYWVKRALYDPPIDTPSNSEVRASKLMENYPFCENLKVRGYVRNI